jgi:nucleotide-binding universal stress UspA family protein
MQQIIVAYDGTESAQRALERGAEVAKAFDAKVIVTSVAALLHSGPRADQQFELHSPPTRGPEIQRDSLADHEAQLADATAFFAERGIEAEPVAVSGDPASAIVSLAERRGADLLVVGTREAGLTERVVHHSVSQRIAKKVQCDLLIVHPRH